jgi:hypothetical protein
MGTVLYESAFFLGKCPTMVLKVSRKTDHVHNNADNWTVRGNIQKKDRQYGLKTFISPCNNGAKSRRSNEPRTLRTVAQVVKYYTYFTNRKYNYLVLRIPYQFLTCARSIQFTPHIPLLWNSFCISFRPRLGLPRCFHSPFLFLIHNIAIFYYSQRMCGMSCLFQIFFHLITLLKLGNFNALWSEEWRLLGCYAVWLL